MASLSKLGEILRRVVGSGSRVGPEVERSGLLPDYTPVEGDYPPGNPNMPFGFLAGLIGWVGRDDAWKVLNYSDLNISPGDSDEAYLKEFSSWHGAHQHDSLRSILFQYDVDARPDVTHALLKVHLQAEVPATVMVFKERIWDREFKKNGGIQIDESYQLDYGLLREFSSAGGHVGFHCNVWERSGFDLNRARDLFRQDVDALRQELEIKYFSMHGGPLDSSGKSNAHLDISELARELGLVWVHNGRSPSFHRNWDDGGAGHENYRYRTGDVADLIGLTQPGQRIRCLFHPQYYRCVDAGDVNNKNQQDYRWFQDMLAEFANHQGDSRQSDDASGADEDDSSGMTETDWFASSYWPDKMNQYANARPEVSSAIASSKSTSEQQPVFINGLSRSGTTLLCGLFDVHPDVAMSYELYPNYVIGTHEKRMESYIDYVEVAFLLRNLSSDDAYRVVAEKGLQDVVRLMACAGHSDLATLDVGDIVYEYVRQPAPIYSYEDALRLISALANLKRVRTGKASWGMKIQGAYEEYLSVWPKGRYIYIMRDGRDILASQLNTGSFAPDPEKLGNGWRYRINRFQDFLATSGAAGCVVKYEQLVGDTEACLRATCDRLDLPYSDVMLQHHTQDISLLHNPRGQLSADRVAKPIDTTAIGRWRQDLDEEQRALFERGAGEALSEWGYE